jgi:hypothetical protein
MLLLPCLRAGDRSSMALYTHRTWALRVKGQNARNVAQCLSARYPLVAYIPKPSNCQHAPGVDGMTDNLPMCR